jgi:hypothetical protein
MMNGVERWGDYSVTMMDGSVTMGHDDLKMVTGQDQHFYCTNLFR